MLPSICFLEEPLLKQNSDGIVRLVSREHVLKLHHRKFMAAADSRFDSTANSSKDTRRVFADSTVFDDETAVSPSTRKIVFKTAAA